MTRKQLESIIRFSSVFNDQANDISVVNEQFGLSLTEATSPSQAVTAYLEAKGIRLEGEAEGYGVIAMASKSYMTTPDPHDMILTDIAKSFDSSQPISNIISWCKSNSAYLNTIKIRVDESEVKHG